ncbi:glycoside hydrolase family 25 protein [Mangrovibrevibacter kandeliae]|uniref:glycoside hydrolase family 25 protein n=1 Tax=Mangrovibrevibacter kandeliae TaxID=2968473 RepID=UPI0021196477|nr:glycoside hydrolase family 25 protein [Aurantimonas sp. CSK15Z-1]MCQ8780692.1 glycoside hydrolase family 25 protein [Aurantimonas sp. CSK15Z-1]
MPKMRAAFAAAMKLACAIVAITVVSHATASATGYNKPWEKDDRALVIDAYEFNPIDWKELTSDKRIAGFINKASDGLPPEWNCSGKSGDEALLCKNRWWKYSVTKELYMTRRAMAKTLGLKWGAYHLGRPGNPREQADHFVDFAEPEADDLIALDIEDNTDEWMSLKDAEIFAQQVKIRIGRYPVLYTNGSTAKWVAEHKDEYPLLSRLPLWYARYREDITGLFPEDNWPSYALWQFSSMHNCSEKQCPYRVKGAKADIDVNVSSFDVAGLQKAWPFDGLLPPQDDDAGSMLMAALDDTAQSTMRKVASIATEVGDLVKGEEGQRLLTAAAEPAKTAPAPGVGEGMLAAYGPATRHATVDPLKLITETAMRERQAGDWKAEGAPAAKATTPRAAAPVPAPAARAASNAEVNAMLPALGDLKDEMSQVRRVVEDAHKPATPPAAAAEDKRADLQGNALVARKLSPVQKSKVLKLLLAAQSKDAQQRLVPASFDGASDLSGRGPRVAMPAGPVLAELSFAERRVSRAFDTTR